MEKPKETRMKPALLVLCTLAILASNSIVMMAQSVNGITIISKVDTGTALFVDDGNAASLDSSATDLYDSGLDIPEPAPPVSNYLSTYFPHPEWSTIFGDNFMVDTRNANDNLINSVKVYQFEVKTDQVGETVELFFGIGSAYANEYGVVLFDVQTNGYQNVRQDTSYSFTATSAARSFDLRLGDGTAPLISITFPTPDTTLLSNTQYTLTWSLTDITAIRYSNLYYSLDAGSSWTLIDSISGGSQSYLWTTPDTFSTQAKLKVKSEDWAGNFGSETTAYSFAIAPGYMENPFGSGWHMMSIPLIPQYTSIDSIFGDDVTGAFFVYDYSQSTGYNLVQDVQHGSGYWLALENPATVDLEGTPAVDSVFLPLALNWNIVGAAMTVSVPLDSLYFTDGITLNAYTEAVNGGWISPAFYRYNNTSGSYELADTLNPWGGYWLQALLGGISMITYPPDQGSADGIESGAAEDDEDDWYISIGLTQGNLTNCLAGFGVHSQATIGYDLWYDIPAPPVSPSGNDVRLIFYHPEWAAPVGIEFCHDLRDPLTPGETAVWEGSIEASEPGEMSVDFGPIDQLLPDGYEASAELMGQTYDLMADPVFSFAYSGPCLTRVIISGNPAGTVGQAMDYPLEFTLNNPFPNPFNPTTTLSFILPVPAHVELSVFDLSGRLVAELADGWMEIGSHQLTFDGAGLSAGVYLYRMTAGEFTSTGKMVLMK